MNILLLYVLFLTGIQSFSYHSPVVGVVVVVVVVVVFPLISRWVNFRQIPCLKNTRKYIFRKKNFLKVTSLPEGGL